MASKPPVKPRQQAIQSAPPNVAGEIQAQIQAHEKRIKSPAAGKRSGAKRDRSWEADHKSTAYRIPIWLREEVKAIAAEEGLTVDNLAAFALNHFVSVYRAGQVRIRKRKSERFIAELPESGNTGAAASGVEADIKRQSSAK